MMKRMLALLLLATTLMVDPAGAAEELSVYFVDVGQGNATLLHQRGKCAMLVDSGPAEQGESLLSVLEQEGIEALDYVVISHPHPDHYVGLQIILADVVIRELSDNGDAGNDAEGFDDYRQLRYELPYSVVAAGDNWQCGDLRVDVLHPSFSMTEATDINSRSLVLRIEYQGTRLLLTGDLAGVGEDSLLAGNADLSADVLQVGHHGAADATSVELLERVQPRMAVVSVGAVNAIEAPDPEVLGRLSDRVEYVFRTDLEGTLKLRLLPSGNFRFSYLP